MDSYSEHPSEYDLDTATVAPDEHVSTAMGTDERRMHVRAYNYWVSLLDGRDYPSIEDLEPGDVSDFASHSVLLDFTGSREDPATPYVGSAIRAECGLPADIRDVGQVPSRSLLSRLTDHYMQIIANRAPIGFEAEFINQREQSICYRGILMPFSSDGDTIDFIYGVINWKDVDGATPANASIAAAPPQERTNPETTPLIEPDSPAHLTWEDGPLADPEIATQTVAIEPDNITPGPDAGLADRLYAARKSAEVCKEADGRSRIALYRALAMAYDFSIAARREPTEYAGLLDSAGIKPQARAPMTPVTKLVFGADYDKSRLTEFAAALSYAERRQIDFGGFLQFVDGQAGGLKALVAAERRERRPANQTDDKGETARAALRAILPVNLRILPADQEFALVILRRSPQGVHQAVAVVDDPAMLERAIRRTAD